ncbi:MAG: type II secretion system protein [Candidatus Levyibacteriota bacterium]
MKQLFSFLPRFKKQTSKKGFTLIELLVVIGILGILAAALVATIDPFEQLKKADDANTKNTAVEFVDATIRYYTTHNAMPWTDNAQAACTSVAGSSPSGLTLNSLTACLSALVSDGELKAGFTNVTNILKAIYLTGTANTAIACFNPQSKAQNHDANTKYDQYGNTSGTCPASTTVSSSCYWCAQ